MVRCVYRQAGTPLADDQDQSLVPDKEGMKELVDRYITSKNILFYSGLFNTNLNVQEDIKFICCLQ